MQYNKRQIHLSRFTITFYKPHSFVQEYIIYAFNSCILTMKHIHIGSTM